MTQRPLHLFGPMADAVAPFVARLGVPVMTESPTTPDAHQLYCHSRVYVNDVTTGGNLWMAQVRAPEGILASWALESGDGGQYAKLLHETFPSIPKDTGIKGLLAILEHMEYTPSLTLEAVVPPHPEPDPAPKAPERWIRHTTAPPATAVTQGRRGYDDSRSGLQAFWQMSPDVRDAWLTDPRGLELMLDRWGGKTPLHIMIWHRGPETSPTVLEYCARSDNEEIRRAWLQGLAHWGTPEQLATAHELRSVVKPRGRADGFFLEDLETAIDGAHGQHLWQRTHAETQGFTGILRLIERDPAFRAALVEHTPPDLRQQCLQGAADAYLEKLPLEMEIGAPHPDRTTIQAYAKRMPLRATRRVRNGSYRLPHLDDREPEWIRPSEDPADGLARLTAFATQVRGNVWRGLDLDTSLEDVITSWGLRATEADDLAVGDWLQSFTGPVSLLARVANGVLTWPTLSTITVAGIARARALSKSVDEKTAPADLIKRIPAEQIPAEWLTIAAQGAKRDA